MSKLTRLHLYIATPILALALGAALFFLLIKPKAELIGEELDALEGIQTEMLQIEGGAGSSSDYTFASWVEEGKQATEDAIEEATQRAEQAKREAEEEQARMQADYERFRASKMVGFPLDLSDEPDRIRLAFWQEQRDRFPPLVPRFLQSTGLQLAGDVAANFAGQLPLDGNAYVAEPGGVMRIPYGTQSIDVQAVGRYEEILDLLRSMDDFDRLLLVSQITIQGQSPYLTVGFPLTIFLFPEGVQQAAAPAAGGGAGFGSAAGAPGSGFGGVSITGPQGAMEGFGG